MSISGDCNLRNHHWMPCTISFFIKQIFLVTNSETTNFNQKSDFVLPTSVTQFPRSVKSKCHTDENCRKYNSNYNKCIELKCVSVSRPCNSSDSCSMDSLCISGNCVHIDTVSHFKKELPLKSSIVYRFFFLKWLTK